MREPMPKPQDQVPLRAIAAELKTLNGYLHTLVEMFDRMHLSRAEVIATSIVGHTLGTTTKNPTEAAKMAVECAVALNEHMGREL